MTLYIMRHGTAEAASPNGDDAARRLTPSGKEKIRQAAGGLRALKIAISLILTSPLERAAETAETVAETLGNGVPRPEVLADLAAGTAPAEIAAALRHFREHKDLLIVGHEPSLSRLASLLLTGSAEAMGIRLKQGGCIALDFPESITRGGAQLRWMLTQRQLRRLAK
jgi:phosphohistidine phosphatase